LGKPAPEISLPSLTDASKTIRSSDLKGQWYVFNVWGTWCYECRVEHPVLMEMSKQNVVPIIGMDWRDKDSDALAMLQQMGNPFTAIPTDHDGREAVDWGVYGAPETFLVNDQGIIVYKFIGAMTREAWEKEFLPRLPRHPATTS
jgi:cytochrome c biogenesis protein CcmG/thiol:disulfide interchange protein DsbE